MKHWCCTLHRHLVWRIKPIDNSRFYTFCHHLCHYYVIIRMITCYEIAIDYGVNMEKNRQSICYGKVTQHICKKNWINVYIRKQHNVCTKCNAGKKLLCYWIIWMWYGLDGYDSLRAITSNILYRTCGKAILHLACGVIAWVVILCKSFREAGDDDGTVTVTDFLVAKMTLLVIWAKWALLCVCVDDEKHVCHLPSLQAWRYFIAITRMQ